MKEKFRTLELAYKPNDCIQRVIECLCLLIKMDGILASLEECQLS